jgi:hypothetical protein
MRRRVWWMVGVLAAVVVVAGGYVILKPPAIREGMTEDEVEQVLGQGLDTRVSNAKYRRNDEPFMGLYGQVDFLGTGRIWWVEFSSEGIVRSFTVEEFPFASRPPWLAAILKPLGL